MSGSILTWHDKHGPAHYPAATDAQLYISSLEMLQDRITEGYIYEGDDDYDEARTILARKDGEAAYRLLERRSRAGFEYERISTSGVRTVDVPPTDEDTQYALEVRVKLDTSSKEQAEERAQFLLDRMLNDRPYGELASYEVYTY